jgi:hypothetical protein
MEERNQETRVIVKVSGQRAYVLKVLKRIESVCPLYLEGKEKPNDNGDGIHVFLTVVIADKETPA